VIDYTSTQLCLVKDPTCGTKSIDPAPCPYDEEIHGRCNACRCCAACRRECARDT
jgi:hypothetical protein